MIGLYKKESPRVVLVASPNNPTGNSYPEEQLSNLMESFRESIVVLDEAYWGFGDSTDDDVADLVKRYRNLLVLRTFSKYYAMAGARIAYAVVGANLSRLTKFAARYLGYNRISEELALAALDSADYYRSARARIREDRSAYYTLFDSLDGFKYFRSDANFVLVRVPAALIESLKEHLLKSNIQIKFFSEPEFKEMVRITIGTGDQNQFLRRAVEEFIERRRAGGRP